MIEVDDMMDDDDKKVYLGFIKLIGEENDGYYRYEFIFTDSIDEFWVRIFPSNHAAYLIILPHQTNI